MTVDWLVITTVASSLLLIASIGIVLTSKKDQIRNVSLSTSTYDSLMRFGDTKRSLDGKSLSVVQIIDSLLAVGENPSACVTDKASAYRKEKS